MLVALGCYLAVSLTVSLGFAALRYHSRTRVVSLDMPVAAAVERLERAGFEVDVIGGHHVRAVSCARSRRAWLTIDERGCVPASAVSKTIAEHHFPA